ncbi:MAG: Na+/H+ antiporter subunit B [Deltaproteobacteria bacterium]|nr:Na+/H+ antiporter subunit B [Deltaproteobacteria bacterium]
MTSLILRTASRFVFPLLVLFSVFLLVRGHNEPGGGFAGGLVASAAFALVVIAYGPAVARKSLRVQPFTLIGSGLLISAGSGVWALVRGEPFLTGQWRMLDLFASGPVELGSPLLFDIGVYLVVFGVVLNIVFSFAEEE